MIIAIIKDCPQASQQTIDVLTQILVAPWSISGQTADSIESVPSAALVDFGNVIDNSKCSPVT